MTSIVCGPSGGFGGKEFVDKVPSESTPGQIRISATGDEGISAIYEPSIAAVQFLYLTPDGIGGPPHHGIHSDDSGAQHEIKLGPKAYVTRLAGRYGKWVDSLEITTVRDEGGGSPRLDTQRFGTSRGGVDFAYEAPPGYEIAGFCGRSFDFIDAIGVVYRPLDERGKNTDPQGVGLGSAAFGGGLGLPQQAIGGRVGSPGQASGDGVFGDGTE